VHAGIASAVGAALALLDAEAETELPVPDVTVSDEHAPSKSPTANVVRIDPIIRSLRS
jgi:hypothetical protein